MIVALAAAVANAVAIALQAAEDRRSPPSRGGRLSLLVVLARRPRWLSGTALMVLAWPLQILALTLAPITVVQPLLAAGQLVLVAIAKLKLRERVGTLEALGALAIVVGVSAVVVAAPRRAVRDPAAARVAGPLLLVGISAVAAYALFRRRPRARLAVVIGAGLAYAWVDFANKLLADDISTGTWGLAAVWLVATIALGGLAFLEETTALQVRPAVTVAPVIGAIQDPLPVLMALWSGVEAWGGSWGRLAPLAAGLALATAGAILLGRSGAVSRVAADGRAAADGPPGRAGRGRAGVRSSRC